MTDHQPTEPPASDLPAGDPPQETVEVHDDPGRSRFDILVDGEQAGFSLYTHPAEDTAGQRIFYHTVIDDRHAGRGLAGTLTRTALRTSVDEGWRIVPVCPYVARWLRDHHDVDEAVDRVRPEHLEAVRRASAGTDGAEGGAR